MKNKLPLPNNLKARYERKTNLYKAFLFLLIFFSLSFSANADVIIPAGTQSFNSLDGSALDGDGSVNGIFTADGSLTIVGVITGPAPVTGMNFQVPAGSMIMEIGSQINGDVSGTSQTGIRITINVSGSLLLKGNGIPSGTAGSAGAKITSNQNAGSCTGGHGGNINITASKITTQTGSVISVNAKCAAGRITMTATVDSVLIQGLVQSKSTLTGTGGNQQPGGGPISIYSICSLTVDDLGKVSSEGSDPGADLVHLEACNVTIYGLVQSTGAGHVSPCCTDILLLRNDAHHPANSTAAVEIWAHDLLVDRTNGHNGEVNANLSVGASKRSWIDLFADSTMTILGRASIPTNTFFAVHANNGGNQPTGGQITAQTVHSKIKMRGNSIQANTGSGGTGGVIQVFAKTDFDLLNNETGGRIEAKGNAHGGDFISRSEAGGILSDPNTKVDVTVGTSTASVLLTGCVSVTPPSVLPVSIVPVITNACVPNPEFEPYVNLPSGCAAPPQNSSSCTVCSGDVVTINKNITIDLSPAVPTIDALLAPFFSFDKSGATANLWTATLNMGGGRLVVQNGFTLKMKQVNNGFSPGLNIKGTCTMEVQNGGHIVIESSNKNAGNLVIQFDGDVTVNGEVRNEVKGTLGLPGCITIVSKCGNLNVGQTGFIKDLGVDPGACGITLLTCSQSTTSTTDCQGNVITNTGTGGDIIISGLVYAFAHAHALPLTLNRPDIKVVSLQGAVTINANTVEPLYDEFPIGGGKYDFYGGVLSLVRDNVNPGTVKVQALKDITVNGHGIDPTTPVRTSFGAIAARALASSSPGGVVDVRSLEGSIIATDRSFDVKGRNLLSTNFAHILLQSKQTIGLSRLGGNDNFNPVVDASGVGSGDKGGVNDIRSFSGSVNVGLNAIVSAAVPAGSGSVQGTNNITYCTAFNNSGTVTPAPVLAVACSPAAPDALFTDCDAIGGTIRMAGNEAVANSFGTAFYPNPAEGNATLRFNSDGNSMFTVNVIDLTGRAVMNVLIEAKDGENIHQLDLTKLSKGVYMLILQNDNSRDQLKILIQ